jgi:two-component system, chemotaxis family, chemotaxis protein CheY
VLQVGAKVLVVEDDTDAREMVAAFLRREGFDVSGAEDGQVALKLIANQRPDLIVTDIQMPNLDGIQLIRALRRMPEMSSVPILVLSAHRSGAIKDALKAGASASARKPVQVDALLDLIKQLILPSVLFAMSIFIGKL